MYKNFEHQWIYAYGDNPRLIWVKLERSSICTRLLLWTYTTNHHILHHNSYPKGRLPPPPSTMNGSYSIPTRVGKQTETVARVCWSESSACKAGDVCRCVLSNCQENVRSLVLLLRQLHRAGRARCSSSPTRTGQLWDYHPSEAQVTLGSSFQTMVVGRTIITSCFGSFPGDLSLQTLGHLPDDHHLKNHVTCDSPILSNSSPLQDSHPVKL